MMLHSQTPGPLSLATAEPWKPSVFRPPSRFLRSPAPKYPLAASALPWYPNGPPPTTPTASAASGAARGPRPVPPPALGQSPPGSPKHSCPLPPSIDSLYMMPVSSCSSFSPLSTPVKTHSHCFTEEATEACVYPHDMFMSVRRDAAHTPHGVLVWAVRKYMEIPNLKVPPHLQLSMHESAASEDGVVRGALGAGLKGKTRAKPVRMTHHKVMSILSRITPQKYEALHEELIMLPLRQADDEELKEICKVVFEKAVQEPSYSGLYARLARDIGAMDNGRETTERSLSRRFRLQLINSCEELFQRPLQLSADDLVDRTTGKLLCVEEAEMKRDRLKHRLVGNIRFVAELFKMGLVMERVINDIVRMLVGNYDPSNPLAKEEYVFEVFATLIRHTGAILQNSPSPLLAQALGAAKTIECSHPKPRIRFLMMDLHDFNLKMGWVPTDTVQKYVQVSPEVSLPPQAPKQSEQSASSLDSQEKNEGTQQQKKQQQQQTKQQQQQQQQQQQAKQKQSQQQQQQQQQTKQKQSQQQQQQQQRNQQQAQQQAQQQEQEQEEGKPLGNEETVERSENQKCGIPSNVSALSNAMNSSIATDKSSNSTSSSKSNRNAKRADNVSISISSSTTATNTTYKSNTNNNNTTNNNNNISHSNDVIAHPPTAAGSAHSDAGPNACTDTTKARHRSQHEPYSGLVLTCVTDLNMSACSNLPPAHSPPTSARAFSDCAGLLSPRPLRSSEFGGSSYQTSEGLRSPWAAGQSRATSLTEIVNMRDVARQMMSRFRSGGGEEEDAVALRLRDMGLQNAIVCLTWWLRLVVTHTTLFEDRSRIAALFSALLCNGACDAPRLCSAVLEWLRFDLEKGEYDNCPRMFDNLAQMILQCHQKCNDALPHIGIVRGIFHCGLMNAVLCDLSKSGGTDKMVTAVKSFHPVCAQVLQCLREPEDERLILRVAAQNRLRLLPYLMSVRADGASMMDSLHSPTMRSRHLPLSPMGEGRASTGRYDPLSQCLVFPRVSDDVEFTLFRRARDNNIYNNNNNNNNNSSRSNSSHSSSHSNIHIPNISTSTYNTSEPFYRWRDDAVSAALAPVGANSTVMQLVSVMRVVGALLAAAHVGGFIAPNALDEVVAAIVAARQGILFQGAIVAELVMFHTQSVRGSEEEPLARRIERAKRTFEHWRAENIINGGAVLQLLETLNEPNDENCLYAVFHDHLTDVSWGAMLNELRGVF